MANPFKDTWTPEQAARDTDCVLLEKVAALLETAVKVTREQTDEIRKGIALIEKNLKKNV